MEQKNLINNSSFFSIKNYIEMDKLTRFNMHIYIFINCKHVWVFEFQI